MLIVIYIILSRGGAFWWQTRCYSGSHRVADGAEIGQFLGKRGLLGCKYVVCRRHHGLDERNEGVGKGEV